jgi:hypothetical protein
MTKSKTKIRTTKLFRIKMVHELNRRINRLRREGKR